MLFQPKGNSYPIADGYLFSVAYSRLESHKKIATFFHHKLGFPRCLADVRGNWIHTPCASSLFKLFGEFFWHCNIHPPARAGKLLHGAGKRNVFQLGVFVFIHVGRLLVVWAGTLSLHTNKIHNILPPWE